MTLVLYANAHTLVLCCIRSGRYSVIPLVRCCHRLFADQSFDHLQLLFLDDE